MSFRPENAERQHWRQFPSQHRNPDDIDSVALSTSWNVVSSVDGRRQLFQNELRASKIQLSKLRRLCINGIPEEKGQQGLRAIVWKLVLGMLPPEKEHWDKVLEQKRIEYKAFCEELIIDPKKSGNGFGMETVRSSSEMDNEVSKISEAHDVTHQDHPLSLGSNSRWNAFFKDSEIKEQIDRDVMRTHPDMHFFSGDGDEAAKHRETNDDEL